MITENELNQNRKFIQIQTLVITLGLLANAVVFGIFGNAIFSRLHKTPSDVHETVQQTAVDASDEASANVERILAELDVLTAKVETRGHPVEVRVSGIEKLIPEDGETE